MKGRRREYRIRSEVLQQAVQGITDEGKKERV